MVAIENDLDSSFSSTSDNLQCLMSIMNMQDSVHDGLFPRTLELGKKLISTQQQYLYQQKTRDNGCLPLGIAKQCKFRFSGNDPEVQQSVQSIFFEAGSRCLDVILHNTKSNTESLKRKYYDSRNKLQHTCTQSGLNYHDFNSKIQHVIHTQKKTCTEMHNKKLIRDQKHFKLYIPTTNSNRTDPTMHRTPKKGRRFKRRPSKICNTK